jgi:prepilin-type processing-associated H-X9-DG protein
LYDTGTKVHEHNDIIPNCRMKKIEHPSGATVLGGGFANCLYADGSCRRVNDVGGYGGKGDGWIGAYKTTGLGTSGTFILDGTAVDEVRDEQWLGRLRSRLSAGGGSSET